MKPDPRRRPFPAPRRGAVRFCGDPRDLASRLAAAAAGSRLFLVTDRNVFRLHGRALGRALARGGVDVRTIVLPPGERTKSRRHRDLLEDRIIRSGADRSSVVAALGGGVVGDLAGFVAATLFRGIRFIQVPTTLVAQVDSSIGGKVGIDHPDGKNLIGAFHPAEAVLLVPAYLRTLPEREYLQGLAEVIKTALILDGRFVRRLETDVRALASRDRAMLREVVSRCASLKTRIVALDEREAGPRRILNYGHTIGHALERASRYAVPHGFAVSIGMAVEAGIALRLGMIGTRDVARTIGLLEAYGLPVSLPGSLDRAPILRAMAFDKKRSGGLVRFTLPSGIGRGVCGVPVPPGVIRDSLRR